MRCHPEQSEAKLKDLAELPLVDATGFLDFARNDRALLRNDSHKIAHRFSPCNREFAAVLAGEPERA